MRTLHFESSQTQKEKRPAFRPDASRKFVRTIAYAVRTVDGSTFTPGPIVEVTAMRWM